MTIKRLPTVPTLPSRIGSDDGRTLIKSLYDNMIKIIDRLNSVVNFVNDYVAPTIPESLPADGGNADTLDGKHAEEFALVTHGTHVPSGGTADTVLKGDLTWETNYDLAHSFTGNGYQKLGNGLIIQWGVSAAGVINVSFPIAFPNACYGAYPVMRHTEARGSDTRDAYCYNEVYEYTTTGFQIHSYSTSMQVMWFAIGI